MTIWQIADDHIKVLIDLAIASYFELISTRRIAYTYIVFAELSQVLKKYRFPVNKNDNIRHIITAKEA